MNKITLWVVLLICAACSHALAQTNLLKNNRYNCVAVNGSIEEMSATADSLVIAYRKDSVITGRDYYQVVSVEPRGEYSLVIVKMDASSLTLVTPKGRKSLNRPLFGAFVFRFEKDDSRLMVLHDGRLWLTPKEAGDTYAAIRLSGEYFNIWYSSDRFAAFIQYPSLNDADQATVEKVALDWIKKITEHKAKKLNTYNTDKFGADYGRDNFTKVLVNNHLSPLANLWDFDKKLKQYNLKLIPDSELPQKNNEPSKPGSISD